MPGPDYLTFHYVAMPTGLVLVSNFLCLANLKMFSSVVVELWEDRRSCFFKEERWKLL